jgi:flagellar hook-length control protein FliK
MPVPSVASDTSVQTSLRPDPAPGRTNTRTAAQSRGTFEQLLGPNTPETPRPSRNDRSAQTSTSRRDDPPRSDDRSARTSDTQTTSDSRRTDNAAPKRDTAKTAGANEPRPADDDKQAATNASQPTPDTAAIDTAVEPVRPDAAMSDVAAATPDAASIVVEASPDTGTTDDDALDGKHDEKTEDKPADGTVLTADTTKPPVAVVANAIPIGIAPVNAAASDADGDELAIDADTAGKPAKSKAGATAPEADAQPKKAAAVQAADDQASPDADAEKKIADVQAEAGATKSETTPSRSDRHADAAAKAKSANGEHAAPAPRHAEAAQQPNEASAEAKPEATQQHARAATGEAAAARPRTTDARFEAPSAQPAVPPTHVDGNFTPTFTLALQSTQHVAAAAQSTAQASNTAQAATVPVSGLAVEIAAHAQDGSKRFEIRLDPPELGRIDVRLDVDDHGRVSSHLVVERSETLDLLKRDAPQLERALQQAGLKTEGGLEFSLRDQGFAQRDQSQRDNPQTMTRVIVPDEEPAIAEATMRSYGRLVGLRGGVDIKI